MQFVRFGIVAVMMSVGLGANAQDYPTKPVKIIVGYVAGGGPDMIARALGQKLTQILGQPFVIENKPGSGGVLATAQVAKMPADGYTLLLGETGQLVIAPHIHKSLPYDPLKDLAPVARVTTDPMILVSNSKSSIKTIQDLMREVKANPGLINYGSSGIGTIHHISMEVFKSDVGLDIVHIPYKGSGQSIPAILAGDVPVLVTTVTAVGPLIRSGALNLLAVTSPSRIPSFPKVPSITEFIKGYDYSSEVGILAPAGLPPAILTKLSAAIKKAVESPEFNAQFKETSTIVTYGTASEYAENLRNNLKKYERAVKLAKIQPE